MPLGPFCPISVRPKGPAQGFCPEQWQGGGVPILPAGSLRAVTGPGCPGSSPSSGCLGVRPPRPVGRACLSNPPCPQEMEDGKSPQITVRLDLDFVKIALVQLRLAGGLDLSSKATVGEPRGPSAAPAPGPSSGVRAECTPRGARQPHGRGQRGALSRVVLDAWVWTPLQAAEKALSQHAAPGAQETGQPLTDLSPALWGRGTTHPTERLSRPFPLCPGSLPAGPIVPVLWPQHT